MTGSYMPLSMLSRVGEFDTESCSSVKFLVRRYYTKKLVKQLPLSKNPIRLHSMKGVYRAI